MSSYPTFGDSNPLTLTPAGIERSGKMIAGYDQVVRIRCKDVQEYVNGVPVVRNMRIYIDLAGGNCISQHLKIDIRPLTMLIPITHLFSKTKREQSKAAIANQRAQKVNQYRMFIVGLHRLTGKAPEKA